ncbi:uncharacterized protein [Aegilops tauschii subsp. strangulata]|uniref:uncharacterized protein n=1 Tax=Aegilops tauschii subsp. strangulata TaxID=200361 RepID=UPI003CC8A040
MVISYNLTRTRRVMANPPAPNIPRVEIPPMNRNLTFQNVDMEHIYHNCWIIRAKVLWKAQIRVNAMGNQYLRCILLDQHGTKMEAIAYSNQAFRFNDMLHTGMTYDFTSVGFNPTDMLDGHFWYICMDYVIALHSRTEVSMSAHRISSSICPPCFPQFGAILSLRDKTITDVVAILVYAGKIQHQWDSVYRRHVPFVEIALMNFRREIIFLRLSQQHAGHHLYHLQRTENLFEKIAVTYVQLN